MRKLSGLPPRMLREDGRPEDGGSRLGGDGSVLVAVEWRLRRRGGAPVIIVE